MAKKKSVVVLDDDDPNILEVVAVVLQDADYDVETFTDPSEFHTRLESADASLALVDIFMKQNDGRQVCRVVKKNPSTARVPVLLMSADPKVDSMAQSAGADAWIEKPFDIDQLVSITREYAI